MKPIEIPFKIQHCALTLSLFTNLPISFTFSPANICVSTPSYGNWHFNYCNYLHCGVQLLDFTDCTLLQARSSPHCLPKLLALSTYNIALVITQTRRVIVTQELVIFRAPDRSLYFVVILCRQKAGEDANPPQ